MASASQNKRGQYSVQFTLNKKRETIYLGKVDKDWANDFARHLQHLVDALRFREPTGRKTQRWLVELGQEWRGKLSKYQLVDAVAVGTLDELCDHELEVAKKKQLKPKTLDKYQDVKENLAEYFGGEKFLHRITPGDAEKFELWLGLHGARKPKKGGPLANATRNNRCKLIRQFFDSAVKNRWLDENPWSVLTIGSTQNPDAQEYVALELIKKVMKHASPEMQLLIACSRYGGIRMMSEMRALRWEWVNLPEGKITVFAPKNERYDHKRYRIVPIYDCWRPYLEAAYESAPDNAEYVLSAGRDLTDTAYRNRLEKTCLRANVTPWVSLWHSMRGSRATDLVAEGFSTHIVAYWQNCSIKVLESNYLKVTADDYAQAILPVCQRTPRKTVSVQIQRIATETE